MKLSYQRTFVPGNESSIGETFIPWNFRTLTLIIIEPIRPYIGLIVQR